MTHIKTGDQVALKAHPHIGFTVSYIEGNKIFCYRVYDMDRVESIVADSSLLIPHHLAEGYIVS